MQTKLTAEIQKRRTFAIIAHPDAGKTTLTEKLLLYGGAVHLAGSVKARKAQKHATSDWMELEKQRGISVTSSVLQFAYNGYQVNILDTPGHQDFSEDTYRTLTAADSAVMLIDVAKGVEEQTKKLFHVARARQIPIFTFVNKLDRHGKDPFDLMAELEEVLGIRSCPMTWPIGMGRDFKGVYDRRQNVVHLFGDVGGHGGKKVLEAIQSVEDPALADILTPALHQQLIEEIELLDVAGDPYDPEKIRRGELTPIFFGSAMTNFGVRPFLEEFLELAPAPGPREGSEGLVQPTDTAFSGFVFKIQANMNPAHRDRIAFIRICSGRFEKGMGVTHVRTGKTVRLSQPQQFLAQDRVQIDEAYPGDVIGLFDPGHFRIGDTLCTGKAFEFRGFPIFSPEHFAQVRPVDAMKSKHFQKGLRELSEEGAIQVYQPVTMAIQDPIVGAVGELQFDVLLFRLQNEYGVEVKFQRLPYTVARWVVGPDFRPQAFQKSDQTCVTDLKERPVVLFQSEWTLNYAVQQHPQLKFLDEAPND